MKLQGKLFGIDSAGNIVTFPPEDLNPNFCDPKPIYEIGRLEPIANVSQGFSAFSGHDTRAFTGEETMSGVQAITLDSYRSSFGDVITNGKIIMLAVPERPTTINKVVQVTQEYKTYEVGDVIKDFKAVCVNEYGWRWEMISPRDIVITRKKFGAGIDDMVIEIEYDWKEIKNDQDRTVPSPSGYGWACS